MADEKDKGLREAVEQLPILVKLLREVAYGKFAEVKTSDGTVFIYNGELKVGVDLFVDGKQATDEKYNKDYETETQKFTVKSGKVIDLKPKEAANVTVTIDASEMKAALESFEQKFATQKTDFEKQIAEVKAAFDKKVDELVSGTLNKIGDLIKAIESLPSAPSQFSRNNGEPAAPQGETAFERAREAAKKITQQAFKN